MAKNNCSGCDNLFPHGYSDGICGLKDVIDSMDCIETEYSKFKSITGELNEYDKEVIALLTEYNQKEMDPYELITFAHKVEQLAKKQDQNRIEMAIGNLIVNVEYNKTLVQAILKIVRNDNEKIGG